MSSLLQHLERNEKSKVEDEQINRLFPKCKPRASPLAFNNESEEIDFTSPNLNAGATRNVFGHQQLQIPRIPPPTTKNPPNNQSKGNKKAGGRAVKKGPTRTHLSLNLENNNGSFLRDKKRLETNPFSPRDSRDLSSVSSSEEIDIERRICNSRPNVRRQFPYESHNSSSPEDSSSGRGEGVFKSPPGMEGDISDEHFENGLCSGGSSGSNSALSPAGTSLGLRDSRIEIAGGREIFSQNRIRAGRRDRRIPLDSSEDIGKMSHILPLRPGVSMKRRKSPNSGLNEGGVGCGGPSGGLWEPPNPMYGRRRRSPGRENHIRGIGRVGEGSPQFENVKGRANEKFGHQKSFEFPKATDFHFTDFQMREGRARGKAMAHHRHSIPHGDFEHSLHRGLPELHSASLLSPPHQSVKIKETVFGSEITSIEKPLRPNDDPPAQFPTSRSHQHFIYETALHAPGEIVFDDIEDAWDEEDEEEVDCDLEALNDPPSLLNVYSGSPYESSEEAKGPLPTSASSPNIKESDKGRKVIGSIPIAEYEGSPKRYGLRHSSSLSLGLGTFKEPDCPITSEKCEAPSIAENGGESVFGRLPSPAPVGPPNSLNPFGSKVPGFPLRVSGEKDFPTETQLPFMVNKAGVNFSKNPFKTSLVETNESLFGLEDDRNLELGAPYSGILNKGNNTSTDSSPDDSVASHHGSGGSNNTNHTTSSEEVRVTEEDLEPSLVSSSQQPPPDYLYEFSETRKVLEEFFNRGATGGYSNDQPANFDELDYTLKRQAGNSYVGQRLAGGESSCVEESPKKPPRRGVLSLSTDFGAEGGGMSPRLISFQEILPGPGLVVSPTSSGDQGRDVNDNDIDADTASTNTETDLGDTEVGLQVGHSRNFTLSPETTDCDSNELESEMSLDYEASLNSSSRLGATMPVLEDGLSSGNVSDNEGDGENPEVRNKKLRKNFLNPPNGATNELNVNPTLLLMKKQITEIEKEIKMKANQQQKFEGNGELPRVQISGDPPLHAFPLDDEKKDPELEALDPMRPTPPPSPAPGIPYLHQASTRHCGPIINPGLTLSPNGPLTTLEASAISPGSSGSSSSTSVAAAIQDIKDAIQRAKSFPIQRNFDGACSSGGNLGQDNSSSSDERLALRESSPVWVPRQGPPSGNHHHRSGNAGVRDPLLRKQRYEETPDDDADTDQETDRLLGKNRTEDDYGFYDDKEWKKLKCRSSLLPSLGKGSLKSSSIRDPRGVGGSVGCNPTATKPLPSFKDPSLPLSASAKPKKEKDGAKKKRSKEDLMNNPSVLIEGVLFRARYLGSTQLVCEGQPTKATRMMQAEEAVSRIKAQVSEEGEEVECVEPEAQVVEGKLGIQDFLIYPNEDDSEGESLLEGETATFFERGQRNPFRPRPEPDVEEEEGARERRKSSTTSSSSPLVGTSPVRRTPVEGLPHMSPPCGSALPGTMFRLRFVGSLEVEEEVGAGRRRRKRPKNAMVEEAVAKLKAPEGETQPSTEVDLFISTEKIMVLNTDLKEIMMDHALRTISYIADIGDLVVLMARRRPVPTDSVDESKIARPPKMICHVFESDEAQYIAQSIGQAFQVAYMEFLKANGIEDHSFVREMDYQEVLNSQEIFGDELQMFAKKELQKEVVVPKTKGEILGVVIVESGWGSMLPTVVIANLAPAGAAARCGQLNIGDQIIAINGVSLVGLPLSTCQNYIKNTKTQTVVKLTVVPCPPVVEVKIKRPDTKYQLGFSVQNGVICSLLRGGIAERGGVRVGHRIIEINNQSVVAVPHEKIVNLLATSVGEINMKTMPTSMFRLLTGQETPLYI